MISVEEAYQLVIRNSRPLSPKTIKLAEAIGHLLAQDIRAPFDLPSFRNSAMDGYALHLSDLKNGKGTLVQSDVIQAGDTRKLSLPPGKCMRIFTGAPVPDGADAVIMQENTTTMDEMVTFSETNPTTQMNIRQIGEQALKGDIALEKGTLIRPATTGYLASLGFTEVSLVPSPKVAIVSTGNELVSPGNPISHGQIYESNSWALKAVLQERFGITAASYQLDDNFENTVEKLSALIKENDLILLSGGISVGDFDLVGKALKELEVEEVFYKVNQKPGKPLFCGRIDTTQIFALPGNPAAALTCFYVYVDPAIRIMKGLDPNPLFEDRLPALNSFSKKGPRAQFLKANIESRGIRILEGQSSNMMHTYAIANGLVYMNEGQSQIEQGELIRVCTL